MARYVTSLALIMPERGGPDVRRYYLVDASPDIRAQMDLIDDPRFRQRAQARRPFDGIFLTHAHMGHYLGLAHLGREAMGMLATPIEKKRPLVALKITGSTRDAKFRISHVETGLVVSQTTKRESMGRLPQSKTITCLAASPRRMRSKASFTSSRPIRDEIISSSFSRPSR